MLVRAIGRLLPCIAMLLCPAALGQSPSKPLSEWIGKTPVVINSRPRRSVYTSEPLRSRLLTLLGRKKYLQLTNFYYTMAPIEKVDGYLIAIMCERHFCPHNSSFMAVNLSEGDIHVAFFSHGYVEWFHTKGKSRDLPSNVLNKLWWMQSPTSVEKVIEKTRRA
jgi:hypothetical protein